MAFRMGKTSHRKGSRARDEKTKPPKPPATEDASGFRPSPHVTTTRKMETGIVVGPTASHHSRAVRSTGAEKNAPAFVVEILETVLARASETAEAARAAAVASVTAVASSVAPVAPVASVAPVAPVASVAASTDATASSRKRNTEAPRKTPRATRPGSSAGDAAAAPRPPWTCSRRRIRDARSRASARTAWRGGARRGVDRRRGASSSAAEKRRRSRAARENDGGTTLNASALVHNAPHGRAHEPFDEDDAPGVPIPLREALRVAAELGDARLLGGIGGTRASGRSSGWISRRWRMTRRARRGLSRPRRATTAARTRPIRSAEKPPRRSARARVGEERRAASRPGGWTRGSRRARAFARSTPSRGHR